jgi:hypothetical protein
VVARAHTHGGGDVCELVVHTCRPVPGRSAAVLDGVELVGGEGLALHAAELEGGEPLGPVLGGVLLEADVGVDPGAGERADDGAEEVDPEARVDVAGHRRRQRPRRVHRSAGHRPANATRNFPAP